ncbi:ABC transporter ATP-binding protein [Kocuria rosea]|uniref:dipeptide ABC transporter ATP-binding protein n=1 Tax=Kocuria rosea TaxID=1275 RepID=UPI000D653252|nr:ABC transporter ATP-binding protein [Kocuria rosea]PWF87187.1 ABC transporter ATP-binding protein [Kocuria rosea]QCY34191.1 ABC transporter ATP-binding protein [Kocuria rosea]TQN38415.1 peptide/nickel transport system ATP-binding protein [Kocuria rosea]
MRPENHAPGADPAPLLEVGNLAVAFSTMNGPIQAVHEASLILREGRTLAIVGESGSGKSTTAMSVIGLLPGNGRVTGGSVRFAGQELVGLDEARMRRIRGRQIGLVPQDPMSNLNPVTTVGRQVAETLLVHGLATRRDVDEKVVAALAAAGLPEPERRARQYPHEFSGGMRQRALIAIGLACRPRLLIADEPTSALDVTVQRTILDQIERMTEEIGTSVLLITHDLGLAAERAQDIVVMHRGRIVEAGPSARVLEDPQDEYTRRLVQAAPSVAAARVGRQNAPSPGRTGAGTTAAAPAAAGPSASGPTAGGVAAPAAQEAAGAAAREPLVVIENLTKVFKGRLGQADFTAVQDVSLTVPRGRTVAIVGESGSGKTTTARMLLKLYEPTSGSIRFDGQDVTGLRGRQLAAFRQRVQPIFQDPYSSLNPMFTIGRIVEEPLSTYGRGTRAERQDRVKWLLEEVALPPSTVSRYPNELSGGQRQRVAIARALALQPELIVCDEPVSALDVLVQKQILDLLGRLQDEFGLSYLFISHDLAVVRLISDEVCVMKDGRLVEAGASEEIFTDPQHPYTRQLLASIPGNELRVGV